MVINGTSYAFNTWVFKIEQLLFLITTELLQTLIEKI